MSGHFLRIQSEGTLKKIAAYRKTLKTAKQTQASVLRVGRLDRVEQGRSAEVHRCGRDMGKEAGTHRKPCHTYPLAHSHRHCFILGHREACFCFNRSSDNDLTQADDRK